MNSSLMTDGIQNIDRNYLIKAIKLADISLLGVYYLTCGIISAIVINKVFEEIKGSRHGTFRFTTTEI